MTAMTQGAVLGAFGQHILVVGADTTSVRLVEELVRAGEYLVVLAHGDVDRDCVEDIQTR